LSLEEKQKVMERNDALLKRIAEIDNRKDVAGGLRVIGEDAGGRKS
jgi:hypothetical protein